MEPVDAPLQGLVGGHVLHPDQVVHRVAGPPHRRHDECPRTQPARDVRTDLDDSTQVLVADDQEVVALRCRAEERLDDLPVGSVDAYADDLDERAPAARDVVDTGPSDLAEMERIRLAGDHRDRTHRVRHRS